MKDEELAEIRKTIEIVRMEAERKLPISLDDTQRAFECCISKPPDCERCPLYEHYELSRRPLMVSWECRVKLKYSIGYWLRQVKQEEG